MRSRNKDVVSDESSKLLDKPEVTQASTKEKKAEAQIQVVLQRTDTRKFNMEILNCIFRILQRLTKRGVQYVDDAYSLEADIYDIYKRLINLMA